MRRGGQRPLPWKRCGDQQGVPAGIRIRRPVASTCTRGLKRWCRGRFLNARPGDGGSGFRCLAHHPARLALPPSGRGPPARSPPNFVDCRCSTATQPPHDAVDDLVTAPSIRRSAPRRPVHPAESAFSRRSPANLGVTDRADHRAGTPAQQGPRAGCQDADQRPINP